MQFICTKTCFVQINDKETGASLVNQKCLEGNPYAFGEIDLLAYSRHFVRTDIPAEEALPVGGFNEQEESGGLGRPELIALAQERGLTGLSRANAQTLRARLRKLDPEIEV